jgi:peroxiredoxin
MNCRQWFYVHLVVCFLLMSSVQLSTCLAQPAGFKKLEIGSVAPDFKLPGVDDKDYQLSDFDDAKVLMVVFTCNHCPTAQAYEKRINQMYSDYCDKGVALVAISPNDALAVRQDELGYSDLGDTLEDMKIRAKDAGFKFPYLYDGETQATSLQFGVLATPHIFVFDESRKLRYKGRIDDSEVGEVKSHDARNAIDALLAGKPVPVETTRVFGCSTKWSTKRDSAKKSLEKWDDEPVELNLLSEGELPKLAKNETKKYRLVTVWATWCTECVAELQEFVTINRMYRKRNFETITISADFADARESALKTLKQNKVACTNYLFDSEDRDKLFDGLDPEWEGALPYTVLIAPGGKIVYRQHGPIDPQKLKRELADRLGRTYAVERVEEKKAKRAKQAEKAK